jgi:hypothetical protein
VNTEDPEIMRALDARLGLDTSPGFEDRLAARIADMDRARLAPPAAEALAGLERLQERERSEADRQARIDMAIMGIAGLGAALAVWRFAPEIAGLFETYASAAQTAPALFTVGTVAVAGAALWPVLRRMGIELRSLVGA